jgi:hypothetical protein
LAGESTHGGGTSPDFSEFGLGDDWAKISFLPNVFVQLGELKRIGQSLGSDGRGGLFWVEFGILLVPVIF